MKQKQAGQTAETARTVKPTAKPKPQTAKQRREKCKEKGIARHWVTVQVQVPANKKRAILGLAENMRSDFKAEIAMHERLEARAARIEADTAEPVTDTAASSTPAEPVAAEPATAEPVIDTTENKTESNLEIDSAIVADVL